MAEELEDHGGGPVSRARALRKNMTEAEQKLWRTLRDSQLGFRFRRQAPIGVYIADFMCHDPKLIVELDGGQHSEQVEYDKARTEWLESRGFTVMRFWNFEVMGEFEAVVEAIYSKLTVLKGSEGR